MRDLSSIYRLLCVIKRECLPETWKELDNSKLICALKLISPRTNDVYYIIKADSTGLCYGYIDSGSPRLGFFDLVDLNNSLGNTLTFDKTFTPKPYYRLVEDILTLQP